MSGIKQTIVVECVTEQLEVENLIIRKKDEGHGLIGRKRLHVYILRIRNNNNITVQLIKYNDIYIYIYYEYNTNIKCTRYLYL